MAFSRTVTFFLIFGLIFMAASASSVRSFRPLAVVAISEEGKKAVAQDMVARKDDDVEGGGGGGATLAVGGFGVVEDSAREVPTGPDPLHHHNDPTWP